MRKTVLSPAATLLVPVYLSACFRYAPASVEPLPGPRTEVKVHLDTAIQVPLGEITLQEVTAIEGIVSEASGDTLSVFGKWLYPRVGEKYDALGATFRVAKGSVAQLEQYRFSPQRTVVALGVTGALVVGFLYAIGLAKFGGTTGEVPPDNQSVRGWGLSR